MICPVAFRYNEQTAENNYYQKALSDLTPENAQIKARAEFDHFSAKLKANGINVITLEDKLIPDTPDSIFPNNWISFHEDGTMVLYPMFAQNRRLERRTDISDILGNDFEISRTIDLSFYENKGLFLEGTGSLILDRENKIAYTCISERTHPDVLADFCSQMNYREITFKASQHYLNELLPIYHTNVMMSVGEEIAVVCTETIRNENEKSALLSSLKKTGKIVLEISEEQKNSFAGNMLQVKSENGKKIMVMSTQAYSSLREDQIDLILKTNQILHSPLDTIEACGGGSARCMMAEIFLPRK